MTRRARSTATSACSRLVSGRIKANSSPPTRPRVSSARASLLRQRETGTSIAAPAWGPPRAVALERLIEVAAGQDGSDRASVVAAALVVGPRADDDGTCRVLQTEDPGRPAVEQRRGLDRDQLVDALGRLATDDCRGHA